MSLSKTVSSALAQLHELVHFVFLNLVEVRPGGPGAEAAGTSEEAAPLDIGPHFSLICDDSLYRGRHSALRVAQVTVHFASGWAPTLQYLFYESTVLGSV